MEAIGMLAGGLAHELHHLVTLLLGSGWSPDPDLPAEDPRRTDSRRLLASAQRAAVLTRQLLAISRHRSLAPRIVDPNELIARGAPAWRGVLGPAITLDLHLDRDLERVKIDPAQFGTALRCLVENARDAMPHGGRLAITTSRARFDEAAARPGDPTPGAYAVVAVADTGCGMTPDVLDRIFDPFFTTKESAGRTGLGLSAVYAIVAQSGGQLRVESRPGEGATFRILLPHLTSGH